MSNNKFFFASPVLPAFKSPLVPQKINAGVLKVIPEQIINQWYCSVVSSLHPEYNSLIGYWKLNEGVGNVANDYSNMMNNGIINNSFWDESDSLLVYDYSLTPRLVDIPIAVLNHLCVPIDNNWELELSLIHI